MTATVHIRTKNTQIRTAMAHRKRQNLKTNTSGMTFALN